jgi:hypothetical protein
VFTNGRRVTEMGFFGGRVILRWIESLSDLSVTVAVLPESVPEEIQLIMEAFVITQVSGPMHQHGKHNLFVGRVVMGVCMEVQVSVYGVVVDSMAPASHRYISEGSHLHACHRESLKSHILPYVCNYQNKST